MKHAIVTGANAGIGYATAKGLLQAGFKVSMFCRNKSKAEEALEALKRETGKDAIDIFIVDFSSLKSISKAAKAFKKKYDSLDVLVNNAGATFANFEKSEDGIELTMAVNHFGYFATTYHLLPLMSSGSRIVNVSSKAHYGGQINLDTINEEKGYFVFKQYEISKLANVLFTKHLAKQLADKNITVNCLHPGVVKTKIGNKAGSKLFGFVWSLFSAFGINPDQGAETSIHVATSDTLNDITGMYFDKKVAYKGSDLSRDEKLQEEFWKWSEEMSGLNYSF